MENTNITLDVFRELGASALQNLQRFMVVSNSLSAARHCQGPLGFVGSHLSGTFVQGNGFLRDMHLREIGRQPANDFQIRRVVTIGL